MSKKAFVALVTCFNEDETINYEATRAQVRRQVAAGNNIMCAGTNGDFTALTFEEKVKLAEAVVDEVGGKVDVIVNAGMPATFETIKLAKEFDRIGVTAIAVITPFFIACTQDGLIRHFSTVADAVKTPIYLYDIPARTQNHIEPETARKLAAHGNIAGDLFACPDGIAFGPMGILWVQTDVSATAMHKGEFARIGANQMLAFDAQTGRFLRFLTGPVNCEVTGAAFTPDGRTLFVNIQHPGESPGERSNPAAPRRFSNWPDFASDGRPRSAHCRV